LSESTYIDAAANAAHAIIEHMTAEDGGLYRTMRNGQAKIPALLEDYAWFVHGLLALHRAQPDDTHWLDLAKRYVNVALERFAAERGGYYDTLVDQSDLFVRVRGTYDGAVPSANGRMIHNLLTLHELTGESHGLDRAGHDLRSFADALQSNGAAMVQMQGALLRATELLPGHHDRHTHLVEERSKARQAVTAEVGSDLHVSHGRAEFSVQLNIADGLHINAAQPGDRSLLPTTLKLADPGGLQLEVAFPEPEQRSFSYADRPLLVYEGDVVIKATLTGLTDNRLPEEGVRLVLAFQACSETACQVPSEVPLLLKP